MKKYLLCLEKQYDIELGEKDYECINNLETMLDNLVYLLQSYGIDDSEILEEIKNDTTINIKELF